MTRQPTYLYLIEAQNGLAKIGCAHSPRQRFQTVHLHCPIPTRLIAVWEGSAAEELQLHKQFKAQRSHSEWFFIEGEFKDFLESKRGTGILDPISDWPVIGVWPNEAKAALAEQRRSESLKHNAWLARLRKAKQPAGAAA